MYGFTYEPGPYFAVNTLHPVYKRVLLIFYVCCSFCDTKRTITICGQKAELLNFICGKKCQIDTTEVFIADLIICSTCFGHHYAHHQELKSIIQWLLPVVFRAVVLNLLFWCGAEGYVSGIQDAIGVLRHIGI